MFDPSREQVRETFFAAWRKYRAGEPLVGIETLALDVILAHPEYHAMLNDPERYRERDYLEEANPFLHMSLHVALEEQLSIDQPPGIVARFRALVQRRGERLEACTGDRMPGGDRLARATRPGAARRRRLPRLPRAQGKEVNAR